jgi:NADH-quinone oxidoreductase subunit M
MASSSLFLSPSTFTALASYGPDLTLSLLVLPLFLLLGLLVPTSADRLYRRALFGSSIILVVTVLLLASVLALPTGFRATLVLPLLPSLPFAALPLSFGLDGLSLPFILLTSLFLHLTLFSLSPSTPRLREALSALIFLAWATFGTFLSRDLLAFFLFFEASLLPIYLLVLLWGSRERRARASLRIALYTLFGSIFRFFTLLYLYTKAGTTNYDLLLTLSFSESDQRLLWLALFLAFAAKIPLLPLHIWLPEAHVEAPTVGSVLLAALLLKLGAYGLVRFALPLFPLGTLYFAPLVNTFAVRSIIYTCLAAIRQTDLKKIIAYSSVGHRNVVLLGLLAGTAEGLQGGLFQRVSHGVVSGALFFLVGALYERHGVRSLHYYGGLAHLTPLLATLFLLFSLGNIAFPLTSAFVGEFLTFAGLFPTSPWVTVFAATSRVLGTVYSLWTFNRLFFGNLRVTALSASHDLTRKEALLFAPLLVLLFVRGIFPTPLLNLFLSDVTNLLEHARLARGL